MGGRRDAGSFSVFGQRPVDSKQYISRVRFYNQIRYKERALRNVMVITHNRSKPAPDEGEDSH